MLSEKFLGRYPSHFKINPIVKAYIISESLIWSAWNFVTPIAAIFVINNVTGGSIQSAAFGYSFYLVSRVIIELIVGRSLIGATDKKKFTYTVLGLFIITLSYLGFAFTSTLLILYLFYFLFGLGIGIAAPAKNSLFSVHLDKDKEASEWGVTDAAVLLSDAIAIIIGGFIATNFGFKPLFILASTINLLGIIPYLIRFDKNIHLKI